MGNVLNCCRKKEKAVTFNNCRSFFPSFQLGSFPISDLPGCPIDASFVSSSPFQKGKSLHPSVDFYQLLNFT